MSRFIFFSGFSFFYAIIMTIHSGEKINNCCVIFFACCFGICEFRVVFLWLVYVANFQLLLLKVELKKEKYGNQSRNMKIIVKECLQEKFPRGVLSKSCSEKFHKIHGWALRNVTLLERDFIIGVVQCIATFLKQPFKRTPSADCFYV